MELEGLVTECGGLDTVATAVLGGLSPGQCQRLAIARLFLRTPKLAMIDEGACWPPLNPPCVVLTSGSCQLRASTCIYDCCELVCCR